MRLHIEELEARHCLSNAPIPYSILAAMARPSSPPLQFVGEHNEDRHAVLDNSAADYNPLDGQLYTIQHVGDFEVVYGGFQSTQNSVAILATTAYVERVAFTSAEPINLTLIAFGNTAAGTMLRSTVAGQFLGEQPGDSLTLTSFADGQTAGPQTVVSPGGNAPFYATVAASFPRTTPFIAEQQFQVSLAEIGSEVVFNATTLAA